MTTSSRGALARDRNFLVAVLLTGGAARAVVWWLKAGFVYPDEIFQYLEPANLRLTGLGWLPWEYDQGIRSWILPSFYGGLMWWLRHLPLDGFALLRVLRLHNALWSVLLVPAAYRLADSFGGRSAARIAALWAALYPPILFYMPHTLSEVPGLLLSTWGLVWWVDSRAALGHTTVALRAGLAFGLGIAVRPTLVLWGLVPGFDGLLHGRLRNLIWFIVGASIPLMIGGLVDWATWGSFFHSTIAYLRYNLIESGASLSGVSPWDFYVRVWLWERMGIGGIVCMMLALLWPRRSALLLLAATLPLVALSAIAHKEERFALSSYPLLLVAGSVGLAQVLDWMSSRDYWRFGRSAVAIFVVFAVLATGLAGSRALDWRWRAGIFAGQRFVGHQSDVTGVLVDDRNHMNGGYLVLDRNVPQFQFSTLLAQHQLFSHLILLTGSPDGEWATSHGFERVAVFHEATVFHRQSRAPTGNGR